MEETEDEEEEETFNIAGKIMNLEINKQITCKDGRVSTCNSFVIADDQTSSIEVRIWSSFKDFEKLKIGDLVAIKGVVL